MQSSRFSKRIRLLAAAGLSVWSFTGGVNGAGPSTGPAAAPISAYMKSTRFPIPFNLEATGAKPTEVHLYVSRDNGANWQLAARQTPLARSFEFESADEGTYWFATRTIDANGIPHPSGPMTPQLRITVDASRPQVEATADADGNGQLILDYGIRDASVADEGIRVEYMTDAGQSWLPLAGASQPSQQATADGLQGRLVWMPQGSWRYAWIRVFVRDRAGNETVLERRVERPRLARQSIQLASSGPIGPAAPSGPVGPSGQASSIGPMGPISPIGPAPSNDTAKPQESPGPMGPMGPMAYVPGQLPAEAMNLNPAAPPAVMGTMLNSSVPSMVPNTPMVPETRAPSQPPGPRTAQEAMRPMTPEEISAPADASPKPTVRSLDALVPESSANKPVEVPDLNAQEPENDLPSGELLRPSRSRQFSLDYEVESVGSRGVEDVELWGTRDNGNTWEKWGSDPDKTTPFDIETTGEGVYGFRIVVVSGSGLASPRPLPGEPADVYILVDSTAPVVRLTSAQYGEGANEGSLVVRFACSDGQLASRPISLSFADNAQGPWTTIAAGLPNTGEYIWPADPHLPRNIYLRIEAKDQAGNVGMHTLDSPISVQGLAPRARIRGFSGQEGDAAETSNPRSAARGRFVR